MPTPGIRCEHGKFAGFCPTCRPRILATNREAKVKRAPRNPEGTPLRAAWFKLSGTPDDRIRVEHDLADFVDHCGSLRSGANRGRPTMGAGDRIILSRMAQRAGAADHCIYGRAVVDVPHRPGIDELPHWLQPLMTTDGWAHERQWPFVVWLRDVEIVRGKASDAPWLSDVMFGAEPVIKPASLRQQSHIRLTETQLTRIDEALETAFGRTGSFYSERPQGIPWSRHLLDRSLPLTRDLIEKRARSAGMT